MSQFLNGSINACIMKNDHLYKYSFNSSMVQLMLVVACNRMSNILFQFLNGSINAPTFLFAELGRGKFQFLNGSINAHGFNLRVLVFFAVSIPQWFN